MKALLILFIVISSTIASKLITTEEIETLFKKVFSGEATSEEHQLLGEVIQILHRPEYVTGRSLEKKSETRTTLDCIICRSAFAALFESIENGQPDNQLTETITAFCVTLGIANHNVCHGAIRLNMPILHYIIKTTPEAKPATFCGLVLQNNHDSNACPFDDPRFEWQVQLPPPAPYAPETTSIIDSKPLTIAVISDAHIDPLYEPNGVANCDEPTCCRKGQSPLRQTLYQPNADEIIVSESLIASDDGQLKLNLSVVPKILENRRRMQRKVLKANAAPAGYWGDYRNCDSPIWAYDDVIDRISEVHKNIDVIYYIGDTIDHGVWETSYSLIDEMNRYVVEKIRNNFGDVPVFAVVGNHESQPTNQFAPSRITEDNLNTTWLYNALASKWGSYLTEDAKKTFQDRGDYMVQVRPGLRVISINNNVAYKYNWWLVFDPLDAKKHLDWLIKELSEAELVGDKVHILAHIPPGVSDLTQTWTREYNRIVNRFSSTITAEFNGHTHSDEFKIYFNEAGAPINMAWGGGSTTSYTYYNLNYKIATFDSKTFEPENIVNYAYNLTEANLTPNKRPHWFQLYDTKDTFGVSDLSAKSMYDLVISMVTNKKQLLDMYSAFFSKLSDDRLSWCNNDCKLDTVCKVVVTVLWERERCSLLSNLFNSP